jgi:exonuclease VII large subunit
MKVDISDVAQVSELVGDLLNRYCSEVSITGVVSKPGIGPHGHIYFQLKSNGGMIRCVCYRQIAKRLFGVLVNGQQVNAFGSIRYNQSHSTVELLVRRCEVQNQEPPISHCEYCDGYGTIPMLTCVQDESPCPVCSEVTR